MRHRIWASMGALAFTAVVTLAMASPAHADLGGDIANLTVADEDHAGYDRSLFGEYDRPALLAANLAAWPDCDGYWSAADEQCYTDAGDVDVDHIVALAEAWDSGASGWTADRLDEFAAATTNLWLMTDSLNRSKGDDDLAEWVPPSGAAVCGYVEAYVAVKVEWGLSVDAAELAALQSLAAGCASKDAGPAPVEDRKPMPSPSPSVSPLTSASAEPGADGELPETGDALPVLLVVGAVAVAGGLGVLWWSRRRRTMSET